MGSCLFYMSLSSLDLVSFAPITGVWQVITWNATPIMVAKETSREYVSFNLSSLFPIKRDLMQMQANILCKL